MPAKTSSKKASTKTASAPRPRGGIAPHKYGFTINAHIDGKPTYLGLAASRKDAEEFLAYFRRMGHAPQPGTHGRSNRAALRVRNAKTSRPAARPAKSAARATSSRKSSRASPGDSASVVKARAKMSQKAQMQAAVDEDAASAEVVEPSTETEENVEQ